MEDRASSIIISFGKLSKWMKKSSWRLRERIWAKLTIRVLIKNVWSIHLNITLMINIGAWNVRGLNNTLKQNEVRLLISRNKIDFVVIVETRVRNSNLEKVN